MRPEKHNLLMKQAIRQWAVYETEDETGNVHGMYTPGRCTGEEALACAIANLGKDRVHHVMDEGMLIQEIG